MALQLSRALLAQCLDHAAGCYPHECCGLIGGRWLGEDAVAERYFQAPNVTSLAQERRFLIDPLFWQQVEDSLDSAGGQIVSVVHSHPDHPDSPSEFDRLHAWPRLSYLIIAVDRGRPASWHSWRLTPDRRRFLADPLLYIEEQRP